MKKIKLQKFQHEQKKKSFETKMANEVHKRERKREGIIFYQTQKKCLNFIMSKIEYETEKNI